MFFKKFGEKRQYVAISESFSIFPYISSKLKNTNGHAVCVGPLCFDVTKNAANEANECDEIF